MCAMARNRREAPSTHDVISSNVPTSDVVNLRGYEDRQAVGKSKLMLCAPPDAIVCSDSREPAQILNAKNSRTWGWATGWKADLRTYFKTQMFAPSAPRLVAEFVKNFGTLRPAFESLDGFRYCIETRSELVAY